MTGKVGYGSPPEHTRWAKGQSGNPRGRQKGTQNFATDLAEELSETIQVNEGGKPKRITKQRALLKSLVTNGIKGDVRAAQLMMNWAAASSSQAGTSGALPPLGPDDLKLLKNYRPQSATSGGRTMIDERMVLQAAKDDFRSFAVYFFQQANQGTKFDENWHIDAMAHQVSRLIAGDARHCLVTMPPRCLKSYMMSVALPAFLLGRNPGEKIVVVTYGEQLGDELSEATLRIMESGPYRLIFPETSLTTRTRRTLKTSLGGQRFSTTIGGAVTGLGGGWLIVDDPLNGPNAYSEALRTQANRFFDETLSTRGDNPKTTRFVVVMQRLHADDLAGHILAQGEWEHLKLQARATEDAIVDIGGGQQHHVKRGDLLHPARLDETVLARRLKQMGTAAFEAQYQQDPLPVTGNQIKYEWLGRYAGPLARDDGIIVQSWDTASKTGVANDTSACTTWLLKDKVSYLLHVWRGRLDFPALREKVINLYHEHGATHLLIEDASSGTALIQDLRVTTPLNVLARRASKLGKEARVDGISGALEGGRVLFPYDAPWLPDFEREMLAFPAGRHDDQVDSVTQYVSWAMERSGSVLFEYYFDGDERFNTEGMVEEILHHRGYWQPASCCGAVEGSIIGN